MLFTLDIKTFQLDVYQKINTTAYCHVLAPTHIFFFLFGNVHFGQVMRLQTLNPHTTGLCGAGCVTLQDAIGGVYEVRHGVPMSRPRADMLGTVAVLFMPDGSVTMARVTDDTTAGSFAEVVDIRPR